MSDTTDVPHVLGEIAGRKAALPLPVRVVSIRRPSAKRTIATLVALVAIATLAGLPFALHYLFLFPRSRAVEVLLVESLVAIVAACAGTPIARRAGLDARLFAQVGRRALLRLGMVLLYAMSIGFGWALLAVFVNMGAFWRDPRDYPGTPAEIIGSLVHVGVVEELVFRWLLLSTVVVCIAWIARRRAADIGGLFFVANLLVAVLFAFVHVDVFAYGFNFSGFVARFVIGLLLGTIYRRVGLDAAMATHAAIDSFLVITFSVPTGFLGGPG